MEEGKRLPKEGEQWLFRPNGGGSTDLSDAVLSAAGRKVTVKKVFYEPDEQHDWEVLPMFRVVFDDPADEGQPWWLADFEIWSDELEEVR